MVGYHGFVSGVTDTDAQAVEIFIATQCIDSVPDAVVATMAAALFEAGNAYFKVDFVVSDQDVFWLVKQIWFLSLQYAPLIGDPMRQDNHHPLLG